MAETPLRNRILAKLREYPFDARGPSAKDLAREVRVLFSPDAPQWRDVLAELRKLQDEGLVKVTVTRGAMHWNLTVRGRRL